MGEKIKFDGVLFLNLGGELIPVIDIQRMPESTEDPGIAVARETAMYYGGVDEVAEIRCCITVRSTRQKMYKIMLGWRGRGPIRMRALIKACKMVASAAPAGGERSCDTCAHYLGGGLCRVNLEAECGAGEYEAWEEKRQEA